MTKQYEPNLEGVDGNLLDGLEFCSNVYDLFDRIWKSTEGVARLHLRPSSLEKRLIEELLPIAQYLQSRYRPGRRIKVRWFSGSQPFDAILWSAGGLVKHRIAPRKVLLEVTTAVHPNEHLARRLLQERGGSFGAKGISRNKKTGEIVTKPYVYSGNERALDLAQQIIDVLKKKSQKQYPRNTVLLVNCVANGPILPDEWSEAVGQVSASRAYDSFREVFLLEMVGGYSETLYGDRKRRRRSG